MEKKENVKETAPDRMKFGSLVGYGMGDFGLTVGWGFLSGYIIFYMTNFVGLSAGVVGMVVMVSRILDAVSDVMVGNAMDKTKTRFGKARPWLLGGVIPLTVCFILLFSVPNLGETGKLLWFIIIYNFSVSVFYTIVSVPYGALTPLMTRDPSSRIKCGVTRMVMGILSGVVISSLTMPMINAMGGDKASWSAWSVIVGIFMAVCILICFLATRERYGGDIKEAPKIKRSFVQAYKSLLTNKYWIILTLALILSYTMQGVQTGTNIYYFKYIIGDENRVGLAAIAMSLPLVFMLMLVPLMSKKFSKGTLARMSTLGRLTAPLILLISPSSLTNMVIKSVFEGIFMAPFVAVNFAMIADVSDYGYWKTGIKSEGLVNSATSFGTKVGMGLGAGIVGWVLTLGRFNAELTVQPDSAIFALKFLMIGVPIVLFVLNFIVLLFYKLDAQYPTIMAEIKQRETSGTQG